MYIYLIKEFYVVLFSLFLIVFYLLLAFFIYFLALVSLIVFQQNELTITEVRMVVTSGVIDWEVVQRKLLEWYKFYILINVVVTQMFIYTKIHQAIH